MTICIAAIAKNGSKEAIVFATDHMITTNLGQFEHTIQKYKQINQSTVAMLAGNPLLFDNLIEVDKTAPYSNIEKKIHENFKKIRKDNIEKEILNIYNVDESFVLEALKGTVPNQYVDTILDKITKYNLQTGILLIGFEGDVAQIAEINETGFENFRDITFHAIGSGRDQAVNTILFQRHSKAAQILPTLYIVYKAKRNAEVIPGVGKETDLALLTTDGYQRIKDSDMKILSQIYEDELAFGKTHEQLNKIDIKA
jgi:hypothetical protein